MAKILCRLLFAALTTVTLLAASFCPARAEDVATPDNETYRDMINDAEKESDYSHYIGIEAMMFGSKTFQHIYLHPITYMPPTIVYISDKSHDNVHKEMAAMAMARLPIREFMTFARAMRNLLDTDAISPELFAFAIFSGHRCRHGDVRELSGPGSR